MTKERPNHMMILMICGLLLTGLTGCQQPRYLLIIQNNSMEPINNIQLSFSGQTFPVNTLAAGEQETAIFDQPPLGEELTIQWQSNQGKQQQSFNTFTHIPRAHHEGRVVIRINTNQSAELLYQQPDQ